MSQGEFQGMDVSGLQRVAQGNRWQANKQAGKSQAGSQKAKSISHWDRIGPVATGRTARGPDWGDWLWLINPSERFHQDNRWWLTHSTVQLRHRG